MRTFFCSRHQQEYFSRAIGCPFCFTATETARPVEREVRKARAAADAKHGAYSVEQLDAFDIQWPVILMEEVGEVGNALTYDGPRERLRHELIDVLVVCSAWVDAIDKADAATTGTP